MEQVALPAQGRLRRGGRPPSGNGRARDRDLAPAPCASRVVGCLGRVRNWIGVVGYVCQDSSSLVYSDCNGNRRSRGRRRQIVCHGHVGTVGRLTPRCSGACSKSWCRRGWAADLRDHRGAAAPHLDDPMCSATRRRRRRAAIGKGAAEGLLEHRRVAVVVGVDVHIVVHVVDAEVFTLITGSSARREAPSTAAAAAASTAAAMAVATAAVRRR